MTRRSALVSLSGLGLAACGSSPTLDLLGSAFSGIGDLGKAPTYAVSDAQIQALPYASLGLRIGNGAPAVMILASVDGEDLTWASADRVVFVTRRGRLIKTVGLPRDLVGTQWTGVDPLRQLPAGLPNSASWSTQRFIDLRPPDDFGVPVETRFDLRGEETITLLGQTHQTLLVRERLRVPKWRWSAENLFWVDRADGRIWRSRQQYCPDVPAMTLEVLKPNAAA